MKRSPFIESFWASVIVMLLVGLVNLINLRFEFTKPIKQGLLDFDVYDLQFSSAGSANTTRDTNIVLVQAGPDRSAIARQLLMLDSLRPKIIGVDVLFPDSTTPVEDFKFLRSLQQLQRKPIFSFRFDADKEGNKIPLNNFFSDSMHLYREGYLDFIGDSLSVVRLYAPFFTPGKEHYSSFSSMILQQAEPVKYEELRGRNNKQETINYSGNLEQYTYFRYDDLDYFLATDQLRRKVRNKIVLLGYFQPVPPLVLEDLHFTPMNEKVNGRSFPDAYGLVIHANIISMVLAGRYIHSWPQWTSYGIAFLLVFLMSWFVSYVHHRFHHPLMHVMLLLFLLASIVVVIGLFVLLFAWFQIKVLLLPIITGLVIAVELFDVNRWLAKLLMSPPGKHDPARRSKKITGA